MPPIMGHVAGKHEERFSGFVSAAGVLPINGHVNSWVISNKSSFSAADTRESPASGEETAAPYFGIQHK